MLYKPGVKIHIVQECGSCAYGSVKITQVHNFFLANGYTLVTDRLQADVIVVNVCGLLEENWLRQLHDIASYAREGNAKDVIIFGCLMNRRDALTQLGAIGFERVLQVHSNKITDIDALFYHTVSVVDCPGNAINTAYLKERDQAYNLYNIIIATGCPFQCSFCTYPLSHGRLRSKPLGEIGNEFSRGLAQGYQNIFLYSDEFGSYGMDKGISIRDLFEEITMRGEGCDYKLFIENCNPMRLVQLFNTLESFFAAGRIAFIDVPIQSGSKKILQSMQRHYDPQAVIACVQKIKALSPHTVVTTDIIYDYPGETTDDFQKSMDLVPYFDFVTFHKLDKKSGTPVAALIDDVSDVERIRREKIITQLEQGLATKKSLRPYF